MTEFLQTFVSCFTVSGSNNPHLSSPATLQWEVKPDGTLRPVNFKLTEEDGEIVCDPALLTLIVELGTEGETNKEKDVET